MKKHRMSYDNLVKAMTVFSGDKEIPREILKHFKDSRKKKKVGSMSSVKKKLDDTMKDIVLVKDNQVKAFEEKCLELCWLMVIQDPPVYMDAITERANDTFNSNTHKNYTKSGNLVDFIVWPSLYLCKDGSILAKGVAQCKESKFLKNQLEQNDPSDGVQHVGLKDLQNDDKTKATNAVKILRNETAIKDVKEKHAHEEKASVALKANNIPSHENERSGSAYEIISEETFDTRL